MNAEHKSETDPTLKIDHSSTVPVYRQVVDNLRSMLVEGALKPGDTLPTVRELGLELGVHFNTVAEAYRLLASEGWLDLRRRRGAVVLERAAPRQQPEAEARFNRSLRQLIAQVRAEGLSVRAITHELERLTRELSI
ncbi:MAG TPA: GntR family transcriptional regulator [Terracidiphilus sp.]|jgi:GntR family transcriptional regulator